MFFAVPSGGKSLGLHIERGEMIGEEVVLLDLEPVFVCFVVYHIEGNAVEVFDCVTLKFCGDFFCVVGSLKDVWLV